MNLRLGLYVLVILGALLTGLGGCDRSKQETGQDSFLREGKYLVVPEGSSLRKKLQIGPAEEKQVRAGLTVPATVEADPSELLKILPPVAGRIVQLHVHLGDWVKKGQPLVTLESPDLTQAFSDLQKAKAQHQQAKRTLDRIRELGQHDIASRREVEQAETEFTSAESEHRRAEARINQLGSSLEAGPSDRMLVLRAPIQGRISELSGAPGGYWNDLNAPVMVLANLSTVWFSASVQEKDILKIYAGQEVVASLASFPSEPFHSKVAFVGEMLDPETRTVKVRMPFDNASRRLLPAMFANVTFSLRPHKGLVVPTSAILQDQFGSRVYVEVAPWTFEIRAVKEGIHLGDEWTEVLEGLKPGERLVMKEGVLLHD